MILAENEQDIFERMVADGLSWPEALVCIVSLIVFGILAYAFIKYVLS